MLVSRFLLRRKVSVSFTSKEWQPLLLVLTYTTFYSVNDNTPTKYEEKWNYSASTSVLCTAGLILDNANKVCLERVVQI